MTNPTKELLPTPRVDEMPIRLLKKSLLMIAHFRGKEGDKTVDDDITQAVKCIEQLERESAALTKRVERMSEALKTIQWGGYRPADTSDDGIEVCPHCANSQRDGHESDCIIKAALEADK